MIHTDARIIMLVHCGFATDKNIVLVGEKIVTFFEECMCNGIIDRKEIVETFSDKWYNASRGVEDSDILGCVT